MKGFTLIELIVVMVIVGVLAVSAVPRFVATAGFQARGFYDEALAMLRYAQKIAVAQRRDVYVNIDAPGRRIYLCYDAAVGCANPVLNPADQAAYSKTGVTGVTLLASAAQFRFDHTNASRPVPGSATVTIQIAGDPDRVVTVEQETGYVH